MIQKSSSLRLVFDVAKYFRENFIDNTLIQKYFYKLRFEDLFDSSQDKIKFQSQLDNITLRLHKYTIADPCHQEAKKITIFGEKKQQKGHDMHQNSLPEIKLGIIFIPDVSGIACINNHSTPFIVLSDHHYIPSMWHEIKITPDQLTGNSRFSSITQILKTVIKTQSELHVLSARILFIVRYPLCKVKYYIILGGDSTVVLEREMVPAVLRAQSIIVLEVTERLQQTID